MADFYLALLHYPVYDKDHKIVTTSITNMDIHDIARSARTYGVKRYFVVTPTRTLRLLAEKILAHWEHGYGSTYNETRKDALSLVALADDLDSTINAIHAETERPHAWWRPQHAPVLDACLLPIFAGSGTLQDRHFSCSWEPAEA